MIVMPVSFLPLIVPLLLIGVPVVLGLSGSKRACIVASALSVLFVVVFLLSIYVPGWLLMRKASRGDPKSLYQLAKWHENHCEQIQTLILWPCGPDVVTGYTCLTKAAEQDYPPALYALGVRLKHECPVITLPKPDEGQAYIDKALALGYKPVVEEPYFYVGVYRGAHLRDPYD